MHPVGGNVLCYADLARRLDAGRPVYGLQAVGLDGGEPQSRIEEMAASYLDALAAVQPAGPYLLGGWSLGGVIAYEMARQLARRGERVDLLALIDSPVPGRLELPPADEAAVLAALVGDLAGQAGQDFAVDPEEPAAGRIRPSGSSCVLRRAADAGVLPPGVGAEGVGRLLRVFAANVDGARPLRARDARPRASARPDAAPAGGRPPRPRSDARLAAAPRLRPGGRGAARRSLLAAARAPRGRPCRAPARAPGRPRASRGRPGAGEPDKEGMNQVAVFEKLSGGGRCRSLRP